MALEPAELQALWDAIPPDRQQLYEGAYDAALSSVGQGDITDDQAMGIIEQILSHYDSGQVPILTGNRWVQVPGRVREAIQKGQNLEEVIEASAAATAAAAGLDTAPTPIRTTSPRQYLPLIVVALAAIVLVFFIMSRLIGRGGAQELTEDQIATMTQEANLLLTPTTDPTATPLGISNADRIISEGDDLQDYFPRILEIVPAGSSDRRVYIVQPREIQISDWEYDTRSPEIASWIQGLLVRPVLGIPFSEENDRFIKSLGFGDTLYLHMSTGTVLRFNVEKSASVNPQDTTIFRQLSPGIVLVLLGDIESATRYVVYGSYPPEQELLRDDVALNIGGATEILRTGEAADLGDTGGTVSVEKSYASLGEGGELPEGFAYLFVDVVIKAGEQAIPTNGLQFDLIDASGTRYSPVSYNTVLSSYIPLVGQTAQPETTTTGSIGYLVPSTIAGSASLNVRTSPSQAPIAFILSFTPPADLFPRALEVVLTGITVERSESGINELVVTARLFNPNEQSVNFRQDDMYVVYSPIDPGGLFPSGPQVSASTINGTVLVGQEVSGGSAIEIEARFQWDGSAFIGIYISGYSWIAEIQ
jgi:hypothetical protein